METATLSTKGQLVIPSRMRNALHLQPGDKVSISLEEGGLVISPIRGGTARLVRSRGGRKVLVAPAGAAPMTTEAVRALLADFP